MFPTNVVIAGTTAAAQARQAGATGRKAAAQGIMQAALAAIPVAGQILVALGFLIQSKLSKADPEAALQGAAVAAGIDYAPVLGTLDVVLRSMKFGGEQREELYFLIGALAKANDPEAAKRSAAAWSAASYEAPQGTAGYGTWDANRFSAGAGASFHARTYIGPEGASHTPAEAAEARRPGYVALQTRAVFESPTAEGRRLALAELLRLLGEPPANVTDEAVNATQNNLLAMLEA